MESHTELAFKPIELEDQAIFNSFLSRNSYQVVEYLFSTMYAWECGYKYQWCLHADHLLIKSHLPDATFFWAPVGSGQQGFKAGVQAIISYCRQHSLPILFGDITDLTKFQLEQLEGYRFNFTEQPNYANYIYRVEDLSLLKGRRYSQKRNHINNFVRLWPNYQVMPISAENIPQCLNLADFWYQNHLKSQNAELEYEFLAIKKMLEAYDALNCIGICIIIGGKVVGFTVGEPLNADTVAIHFEKANAEIEGIYTFMNREFLKECWQQYTYVNRAEDMGEPGLRKAKLDYHPCRLEMKYIATLQE